MKEKTILHKPMQKQFTQNTYTDRELHSITTDECPVFADLAHIRNVIRLVCVMHPMNDFKVSIKFLTYETRTN